MKNVFLIGDSICYGADNSTGYGILVREKLKETADVFVPVENNRFAQYTLRYLHEWAAKWEGHEGKNVDIVHWNNGLWDALELFGESPFTPLEFYTDTLTRIRKRIGMLFPNAQIIFATTTTVVEEEQKPHFRRHNETIRQYNEAAEKTLIPLGVRIDDLYAVSAPMDASFHCDAVHFNEKGCEILSDAVIASIRPYL